MPDQGALAVAYQRRYALLTAHTTARVAATWKAHGGVNDDAAGKFAAAVVPLVNGAQVAVGRMVAGYVAASVREEFGSAVTAAVSPETMTDAALRGVPADEVYQRPVVAARTALAEGHPFEQAMRLAGQRAVEIAGSSLVLAQRSAALQAVSADERIVGYRRVLTGKSCVRCAMASTQRYHRAELMPIHTHCDCSVAPIFGTKDPGLVINRELLKDLKVSGQAGNLSISDAAARQSKQAVAARERAAQARSEATREADAARRARLQQRADSWDAKARRYDAEARSLRDLRSTKYGQGSLPSTVEVRQHGELGPVLTTADHDFTGPDDLAA